MTDIDERRTSRGLVLVVDDDAGVSSALERSLKGLGYGVLVAADGTDGFQKALQAEPAVILADVHMPGMDGHALLRRLTRSGVRSSVVLMSGQGELDDAIGALRGGAVDYLKKPWTLAELGAVLDRAMGLFTALRDLSLAPDVSPSDARARGAGATTVDASALIEELSGRATARGLALPATRPVVARLREMDANGDRAVDVVAGLIEQDGVLAEAVVRMASGTRDPKRQSGDVRAVVAALGIESIRDTVETLALRDAFPIRIAPLRTLNDRIWRFSVSRALAMRGIADIAEADTALDRHLYYRDGLLLDVGASYLLSVVSEAMLRRGGGILDSAAMTAAVRAHHAHIGSLVLQGWGMSSELADLVRDHHADPSPSASPLACAAALGGALAVRIVSFGDPTGESLHSPESLARCAYTLGVGDTVLRRLTKSLGEDANQIWAACA